MLTVLLIAAYRDGEYIRVRSRPFVADGLAVGGQWLDRAARDWMLVRHELNSFGFMHDRPILDLWGYTNRTIATSRVRNAAGMRSRPGQFLEAKPDVLWGFTESLDALLHLEIARFGTPETLLADTPNWGPAFGQAGDLRRVLDEYDPFFVRHGRWLTWMLVRKDLAGPGPGGSRRMVIAWSAGGSWTVGDSMRCTGPLRRMRGLRSLIDRFGFHAGTRRGRIGPQGRRISTGGESGYGTAPWAPCTDH